MLPWSLAEIQLNEVDMGTHGLVHRSSLQANAHTHAVYYQHHHVCCASALTVLTQLILLIIKAIICTCCAPQEHTCILQHFAREA